MTTYIVLTVVIFLLLVAASTPLWVFLVKAKSNHNALWQHAGRPTLWSTQSLTSSWGLVKYLRDRVYLELPNQKAKAFAEKMRLPMLVGYFVSLATFTAIIIFLLYFYG